MKRITIAVVAAFFVCPGLFAQSPGAAPDAAELLRRVDDNETYSTIEYDGEMIIQYQGRRYVKQMRCQARGGTDSFIEFTNPEDAGTRYLKKGSRLYVWSPDTEEVMLISGHMLKESMMGSDMSYEDTISNDSLSSRYTPSLAGSEEWNFSGQNRDCWILELSAKKRTESYPRQRLWIDRQTGDLLHYELYALSGAKLKEYTVNRVEVFGGRRFPVEGVMRDLLRRDSSTTIIMRNVTLDRPIPDSVFSTRNLER